MKRMVKYYFVFTIFILTLLTSVACKDLNEAMIKKNENEIKYKKIMIATGETAGTYYPIGAAITAIITKYIPEVNAMAEPTSGAIENLKLLKNNKVDFALVASNTAYAAYKGEKPFNGEYENLRVAAALYPEVFQFVVLKNSGMKSIYDLKGKRVVVGKMNSGTFRTAKELLKCHGITFDEISPQYLSFKEGIMALQQNKVDCVIIGSGIATAAVVDISAMMDINLLSIDKDTFTKDDMMKYLTLFTIPKGTYRGVNEDILTVASQALLVTSSDMDDIFVNQTVEALFEHVDEIEGVHSQGKNIKLENNFQQMSIPMHFGAIKYYNRFKLSNNPE
ncbi:MAG: TAXI family TRAP transporter solute-binding subunit [Marinisporobacter sp.]|nr:TAXI family TRAP transporter solute-binding subunit [Marinisporobacter sp.]